MAGMLEGQSLARLFCSARGRVVGAELNQRVCIGCDCSSCCIIEDMSSLAYANETMSPRASFFLQRQ